MNDPRRMTTEQKLAERDKVHLCPGCAHELVCVVPARLATARPLPIIGISFCGDYLKDE